jgi:hypothetical protein
VKASVGSISLAWKSVHISWCLPSLYLEACSTVLILSCLPSCLFSQPTIHCALSCPSRKQKCHLVPLHIQTHHVCTIFKLKQCPGLADAAKPFKLSSSTPPTHHHALALLPLHPTWMATEVRPPCRPSCLCGQILPVPDRE